MRSLRTLPRRRWWPATLALALPSLSLGAPTGRLTPIPEIQGRSHHSPLAGQAVNSAGVVTSVAAAAATVQDPRGDGDPGTSDAIVLETAGAPALRVGDRITFRGTVSEVVPGGVRTANLGVTTIVAARVRIERRRGPLPRPVRIGGTSPPAPDIISADELPVNLRDEAAARLNRFDPGADAMDYWESLEAMRVVVAAPVAVSAMQTYDARSSELFVLPDGGRRVAPGRRTAAGGILLQSGAENRGSQNPERVQIQLDSALVRGPAPAVAVGDRLGDVSGIVRYDFGNYEVAATAPLRQFPRPRSEPATRLGPLPDRLTVASYNVLNLGAGPEDSAQRTRLGRQIARALGSPEIVALQEIQDESGERDDGVTDATGTLRALAEAVRAAGGPDYRWFDVAPRDGRQGGAPGGNIRVAFLYNPARVVLRTYYSLSPRHLAQAGVRDPALFRDSRDPLVAEFEAGGRRLTIVNNHLTSRFGSTPAYGAVQPFVQAGEEARAAQVGALRAWVGRRVDADSAARVVVIGDFNTFEFTDDLADLLPGRPPLLHALTAEVPGPDRYSYNYEGNSQALDHAFVTESLRAGAEVEYVHLNADWPAAPGAAASDHDPLVLRLAR